MLHGSEFRRGALHWIWVLCVAAHITSCEGVLHRDDIRGIEFFQLMSKDRSDTHQNQAIVGKKIDLKEVEKWFKGLLGCVNQYRVELKSIRGAITISDYQDDSGHKLDGLEYEEQRIRLPLLEKVNPVDLVSITEGLYRSSLFSGIHEAKRLDRGGTNIWVLHFKFPGCANDFGQHNEEKIFLVSNSEGWDNSVDDVSPVGIGVDQLGSAINFKVKKTLPLLILRYVEDMANKIGTIKNPNTNGELMQEVCRGLRNLTNDEGNFNHLLNGDDRSDLERACEFIKSDQENDNIFDCKKLLTFVAFESVDKCISRAEEIGKKIEKFLENLNNKIREKRGKSKDGRVFLAHNDFKKQYGQGIIDILTSIKGLFGKTSSSIGSATLGYEEEISKCFSKIREKMKGYDQHQSDVLKYMTYSVLHHASKLIGEVTFTPNFEKAIFEQECSCVNIGIINTLNMIHVLLAHNKILEVFSKENVDKYMGSLKEKYRTLTSIADKVGTFSKGLTISDMKEILDIKI